MSRNSLLTGLLMCLAAATGIALLSERTFAQEKTPAANRAERLPENAEGEPELGPIERASHLLGCEVVDQDRQALGRVIDLALDIEAGRVVGLIVEQTGVTPPRWYAIPASKTKTGVMTIMADVSTAAIKKAPQVSIKDATKLTRAWAADNYQHFGVASLWKDGDKLDHPLTLFSSILEFPITNALGKEIGRIEDAALMLDKGIIGYLAISMADGDKAKQTLYSIPLSAFVVPAGEDKWMLELPKSVLAATPSFDANHWPEKIDRGWVEYVHVRYGRSPFAGVRPEARAETP